MNCMGDVAKFQKGDFVKVEFPDKASGVSEWMWVRVEGCDYDKGIIFGVLDNAPVNQSGNRVELGTKLAISFSKILEHRKSSEF
jgi:uncharacterized protein YegJ (DUF2314 family)